MLKFPDIDPIIFSIGPLAIRWYAISYLAGILIAWFYINKLIESKKITKISKEGISDFINYAIIGVIIGGRLGHVIFYNPSKYIQNPIDILKTYEGGMSFHGGMLGVICAGWIFTKKYKIDFWSLIDILALVAPIGLGLGRIANFINAELYGKITDVSWGIIFPNGGMLPRHPSQLYESALEGILMFVILNYFAFKRNCIKKAGFSSGLFLILYGIMRIFVEFYREPDANIGYIYNYFTLGQILSIPMVLVGIFIIKNQSKKWQLMQK